MSGSETRQEAELSATHVRMGRIGAPWGVKGWFKLISFTDPLENLLEYRTFVVTGCRLESLQNDGINKLEIEEAKPQGKGLVARIKGCIEREQCGVYTGAELWIAKNELPALEEGYYWYQLENLKVVNLQGLELGAVHHLLETGANDVLVVRASGVERLLPYVPQVIRKVDLDTGYIEVDWLPEWD